MMTMMVMVVVMMMFWLLRNESNFIAPHCDAETITTSTPTPFALQHSFKLIDVLLLMEIKLLKTTAKTENKK